MTRGRAVDDRFKTELCRNWTVLGRCPYGSRCRFAHGTDDLRPSARREGRRLACREYAVTGACEHGERCRFAHVCIFRTPPISKEREVEREVEGEVEREDSPCRLPVFVRLAEEL